MDDLSQGDICRVCRCEAQQDRPLFYPCICTGSIKYIHQDCLMQWMRYSHKEYCELCGHRFSFQPIYAPDMPRVLPVKDVLVGLMSAVLEAARCWLHYSLPAAAAAAPGPAAAPPADEADAFAAAAAAAAAAAQDDNNNGEAPQDVPPMDNAAPAPADNEGDVQGAGGDPRNPAPVAAGNPAEAEADEQNWNPMEWDRAAEELTWERLLGLDGSLVFLEHVFWITSLNTMFIFTFAFCPYCVGNFILSSMDLLQPEKPLLHFHGLITTLFGYCCIGLTLVVLQFHQRHTFQMRRVCWFIEPTCYIVVKVSLLSVVEIGVLPLVCGWWLDICSLPLLDASLKDRKASFKAAPGTSLFIHWMFGMVYVYYFAAFISLLQEVLCPGVLWIFRNVNDPDFNPIHDMIHVPIVRHIRQLVTSAMILGFAIVLPGFFEQTQTRIWLKGVLRIWCTAVSWLLGIRSYLLPAPEPEPAAAAEGEGEGVGVDGAVENANPDVAPQAPPPPPPPPPVDPFPIHLPRNLAAAHQAIMQRDAPMGFQPYEKPTLFAFRLCALMTLMCLSIVGAAILTLTVPVYIGRRLMVLWDGDSRPRKELLLLPRRKGPLPAVDPEAARKNERLLRAHELYTAEIGGYLCWIVLRGVAVVATLLPQGRTAIVNKLKHWATVTLQYALPVITLVGIFVLVPLLFGLLLELVVVIPLRVPLRKTPIHFLWQDWALGMLYTKIAIALTLMGPEWHLRRALERAYTDGLRDFDLKFVMRDLAGPVVTTFGLALAIPYVMARMVLPVFFVDRYTRQCIYRLVYPVSFAAVGTICFVLFQIKQLKKLYLSIKVDKYLVGQRLVNYENRKKQQQQQQEEEQKARELKERRDKEKELGVDMAMVPEEYADLYGAIDEEPDHADLLARVRRRRELPPRPPLRPDANEELL
ncbi:GL24616 [Drosophila persimilis]|uniref:E3 ubiquitin-protein ligase MARCHF6 n=1 Tax=Drosophila persimilis TaxID=7234 RepID=B4H5V1_DROPE|nr:GL24616 [Drosophila persimilis]